MRFVPITVSLVGIVTGANAERTGTLTIAGRIRRGARGGNRLHCPGGKTRARPMPAKAEMARALTRVGLLSRVVLFHSGRADPAGFAEPHRITPSSAAGRKAEGETGIALDPSAATHGWAAAVLRCWCGLAWRSAAPKPSRQPAHLTRNSGLTIKFTGAKGKPSGNRNRLHSRPVQRLVRPLRLLLGLTEPNLRLHAGTRTADGQTPAGLQPKSLPSETFPHGGPAFPSPG